MKILDPPNPLYDAPRADLENMANELRRALKKPSTQPPPARKK